jgi:Zn-dependent peptidase ImmA (M78 family)
MIPFFERELIRRHTQAALQEYERLRGKRVAFPLDVGDVFEKLFGLETVFDDRGIINQCLGDGIIGCLFPNGHPSPWGKDKLIVVNVTKSPSFNPIRYNDNFTIAHEGAGHYILHFLKGTTGERHDRPEYCRSQEYSSLEWQANFAAGELTQPVDQVIWLLDGRNPPEIINLDLYERNYREYFGASRAMMEARLKTLGYGLFNARYDWTDFRVGLDQREQRSQQRITRKRRSCH